jgi:hypothetical protein
MSHDFVVLAILFGGFFLGLAVIEWRAFHNGTTTISKYTHELAFRSVPAIAWTCLGIGLLVGHFISGSIYCGPP